MLVDDMLSCGKAVKEKVAAQKVKQNQDKVKKAVDSLKPCLEKAASELECNNAILANGIAASAYLSSDIRDQMVDALSACKNALDGLALSEDDVSRLWQCMQIIKQSNSNAWRQNADAFAKTVVGDINVVGIFSSDPAKAQQLSRSIKEKSELDNITAGDVNSFVSDLKSAKSLVAELSFNDEIKMFLDKARIGRATILDLNDEVLKWIKDNHLESKVKIGLN